MSGFMNKVIGKVASLIEKSREDAMLEVGASAPDFTVAAHDGSTVSLADYRGRKVVLWFYPKASTPG